MLFFKPEVLKNGMKIELALRESALYRLALAGYKKRIVTFIEKRRKDRFLKSLVIFQKTHVLKIPIKFSNS